MGLTKGLKPRPTQPVRLYTKGAILGYRRSKVRQYPNQALVKLEGVLTGPEATHYLGKKVAYITKTTRPRKQITGSTGAQKSKFKVNWGKVSKIHGGSGLVRVRFSHNVPPKAFGAPVRIMLYPSNI